MADRVLQRHDTAARWQQYNPILAEGEIGIITDGAKGYKIGDGKTPWNSLPFPANPANVVQETGDSESAVMSQRAVSEEISVFDNFTIGYIGVNGEYVGHDSRHHSEYLLKVNAGSKYRLDIENPIKAKIEFYDKDKKYINYSSWFEDTKYFTTPEGTYYIGISTAVKYDRIGVLSDNEESDIRESVSDNVSEISKLNTILIDDSKDVEVGLTIDSTYVHKDSKIRGTSTLYGIYEIQVEASTLIEFTCYATTDVSVISRKIESGYEPLVVGEERGVRTYRYFTKESCTIALSGGIGSTSTEEKRLHVKTANFVTKDIYKDISVKVEDNSRRIEFLELGSLRLNSVPYQESNLVNQIVDGVASVSTTNTRRVYYTKVMKGETIIIKGDNNNSSKAIEWALYPDVPSVDSVAISYGNDTSVGEVLININIADTAYLAVSINAAYHTKIGFYIPTTFSESSQVSNRYIPTNIKYIPHRGIRSTEIPENTTYSVMYAAMYGIRYAECDVIYTSDRVGVVMHDTTINRTMCNGDLSDISSSMTIADNSYEVLSQYVYKSTNPAYRTQLQTIREYIDACAYWNVCPIIQGAMSGDDLLYCMRRLGDNWICYGGNFNEVRRYSDNVLCLTSESFDTIESMVAKLKGINGNVGISKLFNDELTDEMINTCKDNGWEIMASYAYDKTNISDAIRRGATIVLSDNVGREIHKLLVSSDNGWDKFVHNGSVSGSSIALSGGQYINYIFDKKGVYKVFIEFDGYGRCTLPSCNDSSVFENVALVMNGGVFQYNFTYLKDESYTMSIDANTDMKIKRVIIFYEES